MSKAEVKVMFSTNATLSKVWLDGIRLRFDDGEVAKDLVTGRMHALHWIVRGAPAASYSVAVAAPAAVKKELAKDEPLGGDRIGFGLYDFLL